MRKRRRSRADSGEEPGLDDGSDTGAGAESDPGAAPRPDGPWDESERPVDEDDEGRLHLGSLSLPGRDEVELRLQVDEASGQVASVMLVAADGAVTYVAGWPPQ